MCGGCREDVALIGDPSDMEGMLEKLSQEEVRDKVCDLIDVAKNADSEALTLMEHLEADGL